MKYTLFLVLYIIKNDLQKNDLNHILGNQTSKFQYSNMKMC